ncbi:translational activator for mitochondrial COX1, partial [Sticta canariensis]|nr:translational activator for mitochondrial COX1 [Sticta canariensis]
MHSGFTCHSCRSHLWRAINGKFTTIASRSPPRRKWTSQAKRDAQNLPNSQSCVTQQQRRTVLSTSLRSQEHYRMPNLSVDYGPLLLRPDNLFHPFSKSPLPAIRRRAAFMKANAYCPHPSHHQTHLSTARFKSPTDIAQVEATLPPAHVRFECADCGIPVYCCEDHWAEDYENHIEICDTLHQINEDDHDIRSGREFPEFEYPNPVMEEALVNMTTWDTYLYTREYEAMNDDRSLRQATKLLTYPITIASILHELSPYNIRRGGRLTTEGLKSLSGNPALRYLLHPVKTGGGPDVKGLRRSPPPMRIFILGARAESSLPRNVWLQLTYLFPRVLFHIIFIGPESMMNREKEYPLPARTPENPFGAVIEGRISFQMKMSTYVDYYHTLHEARLFQPFDPYFDCFMLFHPGLGHPASSHEWEETLPQLLETKVPVLCTGYTEWDMNRDWRWVMDKMAGEVDLLMEPGENKFRSLRWDLNDWDPSDVSCGNWGVWAFRGK